jgi:dipeptidyl aminopeptidase/acylaminoacyl peptidase
MTRRVLVGLTLGLALGPIGAAAQQPSFTIPQVLSLPFPDNLVAAPSGQGIAYTIMLRGERSIWVADGPAFAPRQLVSYPDDGQEITSLQFAGNDELVYARGGDHGSNWDAQYNLQPDPSSSPIEPKIEIWALAVAGGAPVELAEGDDPVVSPAGDRVVFTKGRELWIVPTDASQPARRLLFARGESRDPQWSPDGSKLAFVSYRDDHGFIAIYTNDSTPLEYLAPTTNYDWMPKWSPDGTRIAFARRFGRGGAEPQPLEQQPEPWSLWVGDVASGDAHQAWHSPETLRGSVPRTLGGPNLNWAAGDRIVFLSDMDGWPHLYSVPAAGGQATLLTPGDFMVEYVAMTPDRTSVVYNANTGADTNDSQRRHVFRVPVNQAKPVALTSGASTEWAPAVTGDGSTVAYIGATAQIPPLVYVRPLRGGEARDLDVHLIPADFPLQQLVTPEDVTWKAPDGVAIHGQLFRGGRSGGSGRSGRTASAAASAAPPASPAVVFVHGGPPRQMLLGWHYMWYYTNAYAVNQYLANHGYIVLSVNYRLGIGYGYDFHHPPHAGARGAAEYQDVLSGGKYLQTVAGVDPARVGIWGGSYGGFLTAMALGQNSDVFAAGVDFHGVHDRTTWPPERFQLAAAVGDGITEQDMDQLLKVEWQSSPDSYVSKWTSPVLLIQGDDDRNVQFHQTVDLAQRLRKQGVYFEEMVIPDEIHDFLRWHSWAKGDSATVAFLERVLKHKGGAAMQERKP